MFAISEAAKLIKSGFITIDFETNTIRQILAVEHNPKTVSRHLLGSANPVPGTEPGELITLHLLLDATTQPPSGGAGAPTGIYPLLSALELLLYVPTGRPNHIPWIIFVWGGRRILPVRVTEMQIVEESFDSALNPVRAELTVTMKVLKDADLAPSSYGRSLWDVHLQLVQTLAATAPAATLADLGLAGTP